MEPSQLKRQIVSEAVGKLLDEAKVPARYHLKVVEALHKKMVEHEKAIKIHEDHDTRNDRIISEHEHHVMKLKSYLDRDWTGEKGEDGKSVDHKKVVSDVLKRIHQPKDGETPDINLIAAKVLELIPRPEDGDKGKDAVLDEDALMNSLIERVRKEKPFDISHIRNAQGFIKDGIKYKFEELMKGGGSSGVSSGINPQTPVGTINSVNKTFTTTGIVSVAFVDGSPDATAVISGTPNSTIVYSVPPQQYVFAL